MAFAVLDDGVIVENYPEGDLPTLEADLRKRAKRQRPVPQMRLLVSVAPPAKGSGALEMPTFIPILGLREGKIIEF